MGSKLKQLNKRVVGFESANSYAKVFSGNKSIVYPNTISLSSLESFKKITEGEEIKKIDRDHNTTYEFEDITFHAGRTFNYITSSNDDISRYSTDDYKRECLVAISHLVDDGDNVVAVTGIPSIHYHNKEDITKLINTNLKGTHILKIDGQDLSFTIDKVEVTLQPLGTFFYCVLNTDGSTDDEMVERFEETKTLVIDIGWKTTDLAMLYGSELTGFKHINIAMESAYQQIADKLKVKYKDRPIVSMDIDLFDLEKKIRKNKVISLGNQQYNTEDIVKEVFEETITQILKKVSRVVALAEYTSIIYTGGGTIALLTPLKESLSIDKDGKVTLPENVFIVEDDAQMANPTGYYVYGQYVI